MSYFNNALFRNSIDGSTFTDQYKTFMQQKVNDVFSFASDVYTVIYNGSPLTARVMSKGGTGTKEIMDNFRKIVPQNISQTFNLGDMFNFSNYDWMVINTRYIDRVTSSCIVQRCNNILKWIDKNGNIQSFPCIAETLTDKREEIKDYKMIEVEFGKFHISLPYNQITQTIYPGQRFILNNAAWRVAFVDNLTNVINGVGYLILIFDSDTITEKDNLLLGIADYYNHNYAINIVNGSDITIQQNSSVQLNVVVTDNNTLVPSPTLLYSSDNTSVCTVSSGGLVTGVGIGTANVTVSFGSISTIITINVANNISNSYTAVIQGNNNASIGSVQNYNVIWLNNGVEVNDTAVLWWLTAADGVSSTTLATLSWSGNIATLTIGEQIGSVILWVKNVNNVQTSLNITISPLW